MSGLFILAILLAVWLLILYAVQRRERASLSLWGPILMWKTEKGKKLIARIARKRRFWRIYADAGIVISLVVMVATFALILWNVYLTFQIAPENAPSPQMLIGLPGINPVIPIGYGILAIAVAIIIHEFSHGILAMVGKIKVKALGLIFLIVPIGAFVEPDEEEMEQVSARKRSRVFAAGPTTNLILALACALVFSSLLVGSVSPAVEGVMVTGTVPHGPFDVAGTQAWSAVTAINGTAVSDMERYEELVERLSPHVTYNVTVFHGGSTALAPVRGGLVVAGVADDYPAQQAGLQRGDILAIINGTTITNGTVFSDLLNETRAGESITIQYYRYHNQTWHLNATTAVLADKHGYYAKKFPRDNREDYRGRGFLGLSTVPLGITTAAIDSYTQRMAHPLTDRQSFFLYLALPFAGLSPFPEGFTALFETPFAPDLFWPLANVFYWLFWLNFALGTFNVLPAIPLDGGYIFRDGMASLFTRVRKKMDKERAERIASGVTTFFSVMVLLAIVAIIVVPRLRLFF
ncbi:MAG: site-2 protease family protein [Candidatus Thermoplasmatota archaeon]|nr:site-2 protease family protein [Candidatus Thermoplasmatota archaeon]